MMSDIPVLHYFEGRGNGEFVRMALAAAGIEVILKKCPFLYYYFSFLLCTFKWTEKYLREPEDVDKLRNGVLLFHYYLLLYYLFELLLFVPITDGLVLYGQVPLLQWKGVNMVQSGPIVRYIARHYNLCGKPGEDFQ